VTDRACGSCRHWKPPSERTDWRGPIDIEWDGMADTYAERQRIADEADKKLGECHGIPMHPTVAQLPTPAAAVIDGSDYFAQVYTAAEFFCALWGASTE
jgi:hypothetical protein